MPTKISGAMVRTNVEVYRDDYEWAMRYAFTHHTTVDAIIRYSLAQFRGHAIALLDGFPDKSEESDPTPPAP